MASSEADPPRLQSPSVTTSATSPLTVTTRASGRRAVGPWGMGWDGMGEQTKGWL